MQQFFSPSAHNYFIGLGWKISMLLLLDWSAFFGAWLQPQITVCRCIFNYIFRVGHIKSYWGEGWGGGGATHSIFWVENVRGGWVVNNDDVAELSPEPAEVLNIVAPMEHAGFSEESRPEHAPLVQQVCHGVCVLAKPNKNKHAVSMLKRQILTVSWSRPT